MAVDPTPRPINREPAPINRKPRRQPISPVPRGGDPARPNGAVATLTGGKAGQTIPAAESPVDVQALRSMLVKYGYNIPKTGSTAGPVFKAALKDFLQPDAHHPVSQKLMKLLGIDQGHFASGLRNPDAFNQRLGLQPGGKVTAPTKTPSTRLTPDGDPTPADVASMYGGGGGDAPAIDLSGLAGLLPMIGKIGTNLPLVPTSLADKLAGLQYDTKIRDLGIAGQRQTRDAAESMHDIDHWYDQVGAAQKTAGTRDHAISEAGVNSVKDAVAKVVASLGGSANQGSGLVGAAGADATGTLAALGANEDQYNADLAPLLKGESASALARQSARNTASAQDIQNELLDAQGQRGGAKAQALMQILDANAQRRSANNSLDQQRFSDSLALESAREAAALTGAKIIGYDAKARQPAKPAKGSFAASSTGDRTNYTKDVLSQVMPGGKLPPGMSRAKATAIAQRLARIYFPHGGIPNGTGLISSIIQHAGL